MLPRQADAVPYVQQVIATGRYPYFERILVEAEDYPDLDAVFERRLAFVLDGLAANLERRPSAPSAD